MNDVPSKWVASQIPSQAGKKIVITGANSGIGFVTALELARHGADVVLACRNETKAKDAIEKIEAELKLSPEAGKVEFRKLDVSSLASVHAFADDFTATNDRLDILVNNAGILAVPYALTADGFESQFATNHLGHFALTARLFDLLKKSPSARVVSISSLAHRAAKMDLNEIVPKKETYKEYGTYQKTKLYNLLFTHELNRRAQANGVKNVIAVAAHPGVTDTPLGETMFANSSWLFTAALRLVFMTPLAQTTEYGALPTLYAAVGENVQPDDYFGPDGFNNMVGYPKKEQPQNVSKSEVHAKALWDESERLAKLQFKF